MRERMRGEVAFSSRPHPGMGLFAALLMKKTQIHWRMFAACAFLALSLQSCLSFGASSPFQNKNTTNGSQIGINTTQEANFKGKIYLTIDHNLYILDGNANLKQLTHGIEVYDPAASPDGKWIAFSVRYKNYSDLAYIPTSGGNPTVLLDGNGHFIAIPNDPNPPKNTYYWYTQPSWSNDSKSLIFLSDIEKEDWYAATNIDAPLLDLQAFSIPFDAPGSKPQDVAYTVYGDGGLRDPSYRPAHPDQIIYTSYRYDSTQTKQVVQLMLEDPNAIANHPYTYHPGFDPGVALTPPTPDLVNMQPAFSPDGNTIIYVRREDTTHISLYTMPVAEGATGNPNNPQFNPNSMSNAQQALLPYNQSSKLLTKEYLSQPIWSPDGHQIAYYDYNNSTFDLWLATVVKNPRTPGVYTVKADSEVQVTNAQGHLDGESRAAWTA